MTFQNDIVGSSPARHALMRPSVLLFGATSMLGFNLAQLFPETILPFVTPANRCRTLRQWPVLKLENPDWPKTLFSRHEPEILLYCHAVRDVPKCQAAPAWAREINVEYVRRLLRVLPEKAKLVYVSSDHVFGGNGVYDEKSTPCPISVHGRTRVDAEELTLTRSGSLATTERCQRSARSVKASIFDSFACFAVV